MSQVRCQGCGQLLRAGARFCGTCGMATAQPPAHSSTPAASVACPRCGSTMRAEAHFCPVCGCQASAPAGAAGPAAPSFSPPGAPSRPAPAGVPPSPSPTAGPAFSGRAEGRSRAYLLRHALLTSMLTLGLVLSLGSIYARDEGRPDPEPPPAEPVLVSPVPEPVELTPLYPDPVVKIRYGRTGRFGLRTTQGDPDRRDDDNKNLTFSSEGETSNTRVYVDGETPIYGGEEGRLVQAPAWRDGTFVSAWEYGRVRVEQRVKVVMGTTTQLLDSMRIDYVLRNEDNVGHQVGLRMMIDTLIGGNDGVPFVVPGRSGITDRALALTGDEIPDFIQALEHADLVNPGVIVNMTLRGAATAPDRVVISAWSSCDMDWDYLESLGGEGGPLDRDGIEGHTPDSAIALYFDPLNLAPGESREVVTYYGLGGISSTTSRNASLSLTFARQVQEGELFWVVAMVVEPSEGQTVRLDLPDGLALASTESGEKAVVFAPGDPYTQVSWLVEARQPAEGTIRVTLAPQGLDEEQAIKVVSRGVTR